MTALIILLLVLLGGWAVYRIVRKTKKGGGCCGEHEESVKRVSVKDRTRSHYPYTLTLQIGGMTCDNCAARVENALNALPDTWARVDIADQKAVVLMKSEPAEKVLRHAVAAAGYTVTAVR